MNISIRDFVESDYPVVTEIWNAADPHYPRTEHEMRDVYENRHPKCRHRRWVAEECGLVVALAEYSQNPRHDPRNFDLRVQVRPDRQGCGIGSAMYEHVVAALESFDPAKLSTWTREGMARSVRFISDRGYVETKREWPSKLDLTALDPAAYGEAEAKAREAGVELKALPEIEKDDDYVQRLMDTQHVLECDVPGWDEPLVLTPDQFKGRLYTPALLPEAYVVAVAGDEYVGISSLWQHDPQDPEAFLNTKLTGVRREYRRRGIALAMKVHALRWCKDRGYKEVRTDNEVNNPMFLINERLGFVADPAWVAYVKMLREG